MKINRWLIETFGFSRAEMYGIWGVLILIILLALFPRVYFRSQQQALSFSQSKEEKAALAEWAEEMNQKIRIKEKEKKKEWKTYHKIEYAERNSKSKSKTYSRFPAKKPYKVKAEPEKLAPISINQTNAESLQAIKGIGPTLSERIIKYRDLLGGFHDAAQLSEVYGLSPEVIAKLSETIVLSDSVGHININTDSLKLLSKHPYIDYRLAKKIVNYRHVHGDYKQPADLLLLKTMSDSLYQKLYPYISTSSSD